MRTRSVLSALLLSSLLSLAGVAVPAGANALQLFSETFDGYTSFPSFDTGGYVNPGLPLVAEGADETWYGIRFDVPSSYCSPSSSQDCDLAVQKIGGTLDPTPVGRFEDEAGIVLHVSTLGVTDTTLDFDWRLYSAAGADTMRVGYFVGDITPYGSSSFLDAQTGSYAWSNWTALTDPSGLQGSSFQHQSYALPDGQADLWVAFWLDNGEGDFGKVDNIVVAAVPEPATALLLAGGLAALALRRRATR
jgi:hypothetical protein